MMRTARAGLARISDALKGCVSNAIPVAAPGSARMGARGATPQAASDLGIRGPAVAPYGSRKTLLNRESSAPVAAAARQRDPRNINAARRAPCPRARSVGVPSDRARQPRGNQLPEIYSFSDRNAWQQQMPGSEAHQRLQGDTTDLGRMSRVPWAGLAGRGDNDARHLTSASARVISYRGTGSSPLARLSCFDASPEAGKPNA